MTRPSWRDQAACQGVNPDLMFPTDGAGVVWAKRICDDCPVRAACLDYALRNREEHGVWGGLSERERVRLRKRRRAA